MDLLDQHLLCMLASNVDIASLLRLRVTSKSLSSTLSQNPHLWSRAVQNSGMKPEALLEFLCGGSCRTLVLARSDKHIVEDMHGEEQADMRQEEQRSRFERGLRYCDPHPQTQGSRAFRLASMLPRLQDLSVDEGTSCVGGMTDGLATAIGKCCPDLRKLEVSFARGPVLGLPAERFTDDGLITLAKGCPRLQVLKLHNCAAISDRSMYAVAAHCTMLQELDLRGFSERLGDWGLSVLLASAAPHMTKLHLSSKMLKATDALMESAQRLAHQPGTTCGPFQNTHMMASSISAIRRSHEDVSSQYLHSHPSFHFYAPQQQPRHQQPPQYQLQQPQQQQRQQQQPCTHAHASSLPQQPSAPPQCHRQTHTPQSASSWVGYPKLSSLKLSQSATDRSLAALAALPAAEGGMHFQPSVQQGALLFPSLQELHAGKCEGMTAAGVEHLIRSDRCPNLRTLVLPSNLASQLPEQMAIQERTYLQLSMRPLSSKRGTKTEVLLKKM